ncbi:double-strand break repair protein MRE11-like isoform X2 [Gordionus sp. m RMFG-2023]
MAYKNVVYLRPESSCPADNFKVPTMDSNGTLGERNGNELNGGDDGHVEDEYFNLFVLHQNRTKHGPTNYIPEHFLEDFLDLVIWGHEHECLIDPQWNAEKSFFVSQPGSSIATSLSAGEAVPKHVALLQIKNKSFKMNKIPLKTVRPFVILDSKPPSVPSAAKLFLLNAMENALKNDIPRLITGDPRQPTLPLIRIRVEYDEKLDFLNPIKFGQAFVDTVANPKDIIHFLKKKNESTEHKEDRLALKKFMTKTCPFDPVLLEGTGQDGSSDVFGSLSVSGVEELVKTFLDKAGTINQLSILTEKGLGLAIRQFIDKQEFDSISELVGHQLHKIQKDLIEKQNRENIVNEEILDKAIIKFKEARILRQLTQQERDERRISTANTNGGGEIDGSGKDDNVDILLEEDSDIEDRIPISSGAMEGRSRGKGNDNDDRQINSSNIAKTKKNRQDSSFPSILSRGINDDDFDNPFVDKTSDHNTSKNKTRSAEIDAQRTKSDKGGDANFTSDSDDDLISQFASGQEAATLSQNKSDKGGSKNSESISLFTDTRNHENDGGIVGNSNGSLIDLDDMEVDIYDSCDSVDVEVARKSTRKTATTTTTLKESKQGAKKPNPKSTKNPKNTEPKGTSSGKDIRSYYSSSQLSFSSHGAQKPKKDSGDTIISKTTRSTKNKKVFRI